MTEPLSERTKHLVDLIAQSALRADVLTLLSMPSALYGPPTSAVYERIRFSVIKLVLESGRRGLEFANRTYLEDSRDLLVGAGFADDIHAHDAWADSMLSRMHAPR